MAKDVFFSSVSSFFSDVVVAAAAAAVEDAVVVGRYWCSCSPALTAPVAPSDVHFLRAASMRPPSGKIEKFKVAKATVILLIGFCNKIDGRGRIRTYTRVHTNRGAIGWGAPALEHTARATRHEFAVAENATKLCRQSPHRQQLAFVVARPTVAGGMDKCEQQNQREREAERK